MCLFHKWPEKLVIMLLHAHKLACDLFSLYFDSCPTIARSAWNFGECMYQISHLLTMLTVVDSRMIMCFLAKVDAKHLPPLSLPSSVPTSKVVCVDAIWMCSTWSLSEVTWDHVAIACRACTANCKCSLYSLAFPFGLSCAGFWLCSLTKCINKACYSPFRGQKYNSFCSFCLQSEGAVCTQDPNFSCPCRWLL